MKPITRKITAILMAAMVLTAVLCGCGQTGQTGQAQAGSSQNSETQKPASGAAKTSQSGEPIGTVLSETKDSLTIVDQAGREVTVKKDPQTIALCYRVVIRFLLNLDQGDKIKGIGKTEDFLQDLQPSLRDCMDVGKGVADIEALAELKPEVFFHKASDLDTLQAVEDIGIPAVGIDVETPGQMIQALKIMGKVCGAEEKAEKLISYYNKKLKKTEKLVASVKDKKTAVIMGSSIGKVADGTMLQGQMIERAGAVNCAADLKAPGLWPSAGAEQIFAWNPDYIFISGSESAIYTAEDILTDPSWSEMKAVKAGHVYVMPAAEDSWEFPGIVSVLGTDYMIHMMYPELMSDKDLEKNVDQCYKLCYGKTIDRRTLGY